MSDESKPGTSSLLAEAGESMDAKAAAAATPATAGAHRMGPKAKSGAPTSRRSQTRTRTSAGKPPAPLSEPPSELSAPVTAPECILDACRSLAIGRQPPLEILYLRGPAELHTAQHDQALDAGIWVLSRWAPGDEPQDGRMAAYVGGGQP